MGLLLRGSPSLQSLRLFRYPHSLALPPVVYCSAGTTHNGTPQALYCDRKNAFVITREPTDAELSESLTEPKSHFEKACKKLGIEVIPANSPQGKGRGERNHGLDQDRLVKELRLAGISTIEEANRFLH